MWDLNEDWNPNLNFMWVPCQIWVHPFTCFWIQAGFKSGLNFHVGPSLLPLLAHLLLFSPFSLTLLRCFSTSLSCSQPLQSPYTAPFLSQTPIKKNIPYFCKDPKNTTKPSTTPSRPNHWSRPSWNRYGDRTTSLAFKRDGLFEVFFSLDCEIKVWVSDPFDSGVDEPADLVETVWELGGVWEWRHSWDGGGPSG